MRSLGVDNLTIRPVGFPVIGELSSKLSGDDLVREGAAETFVVRCARSFSYGHYSGVTQEQTFKSSGRFVSLGCLKPRFDLFSLGTGTHQNPIRWPLTGVAL